MFTFKMCPLFTRCHLDALRRTAPGAGACPAERRQRGRWVASSSDRGVTSGVEEAVTWKLEALREGVLDPFVVFQYLRVALRESRFVLFLSPTPQTRWLGWLGRSQTRERSWGFSF